MTIIIHPHRCHRGYVIACALLLSLSAIAHTKAEQDDSVACTFFFRKGSHALDTAFCHNGQVMTRLQSAVSTRSFPPYKVIIQASSSPEGNTHFNHLLSTRRAEWARMLADGLIPGTGSKATIIDHGEAWQQLRASIAADTLGDSGSVSF